MALIVDKICTTCNKPFMGDFHEPNCVCSSCLQLADKEMKRKYFEVLDNLSTTERIKRLEELVYELTRPKRKSNNRLR